MFIPMAIGDENVFALHELQPLVQFHLVRSLRRFDQLLFLNNYHTYNNGPTIISYRFSFGHNWSICSAFRRRSAWISPPSFRRSPTGQLGRVLCDETHERILKHISNLHSSPLAPHSLLHLFAATLWRQCASLELCVLNCFTILAFFASRWTRSGARRYSENRNCWRR